MRISRTIILAAVAAAGVFAQPVADAVAGNRWHMQFGWPFAHQGPYGPGQPRYYYYEPDYYYDDGPYDPYYGDEEAYYDPYYYEPPPRRKKRAARIYEDPGYEPVPTKKKRKLSAAKAYSDPEIDDPRYYAPAPKKVKKPQVSSATAAQPKKATKEAAAGGISCDKAKTIIGDYGFASITPTDCEGAVLGFKAQRDGKSFSIKVSSLNGELTEVKRQ